MSKIALCFIISGKHIVNKEHLWKKWIKPNSDIINVYFHYKNSSKITSEWIKEHALPENKIQPSSYYYVINAYMALIHHAHQSDANNTWFCLVTESCVPIVSPSQFRKRFEEHKNKSIMRWGNPCWNIWFHKRANLAHLPVQYHLTHDPWFILTRKHVAFCLHFLATNPKIYRTINNGGLANESMIAIILKAYDSIGEENVINSVSTVADWERKVSSPTSPWTFNGASNQQDEHVISELLRVNPNALFLRKVSQEFPDKLLEKYIDE
jgi:hypothetical protein